MSEANSRATITVDAFGELASFRKQATTRVIPAQPMKIHETCIHSIM